MDRSSYKVIGNGRGVVLRINDRHPVESLNGEIAVRGIITEEGEQIITGFKTFDINTLFKGGITIGDGTDHQTLTIKRNVNSLGHEMVSGLEDTTGNWYSELIKNDTTIGRVSIDAASGNFLYNNNIIWHAGNDGHESGLNADLLDGLHADDLALAGHTHNFLTDGTGIFYTPERAAGDYVLATADELAGYLPLSGGTITGETFFSHNIKLTFKAAGGTDSSIYQNNNNLSVSGENITNTATGNFSQKASTQEFIYTNNLVFIHDILGNGNSLGKYQLPVKETGNYIIATIEDLNNLGDLYLPLAGGTLTGDLGINTGSAVPGANLHIKGRGTDLNTSALKVENAGGVVGLEVKDDGSTFVKGINVSQGGIISWLQSENIGMEIGYQTDFGSNIYSDYALNINSNTTLTLSGSEWLKIKPRNPNPSAYFEVEYPNIDFVQAGVRFNLPVGKTGPQTLATLEDLLLESGKYLPLAGGTMSGDIIMSGTSDISFTGDSYIISAGKNTLSGTSFELVIGDNRIFKNPVKPAGTYTFATMEDITGLTDGYLPLTGGTISSPGSTASTSGLIVQNSAGLIGLKVSDDANISLGKNIFYTDASGIKMKFTNQNLSIGSDYTKPQISLLSQNFGNEVYNIHSNANTTKHTLHHATVTPELHFSLKKGSNEQLYRLPNNKTSGNIYTLATLEDVGFKKITAPPVLTFTNNFDWHFKTTSVASAINVTLDAVATHVNGNQIILNIDGTGDNPLVFSDEFKLYGWENGNIVISAVRFHIFYYDANNIAVVYWPGMALTDHHHDDLYLQLTGGALTGPLKIGDYTLPLTDGIEGQVLTTNGAGVTEWRNKHLPGTEGQILIYNADGLPVAVTPENAFNKTFGSGAGQVAEGNKYLQLTGGTLTGNLVMDDKTIDFIVSGQVEGSLSIISDAGVITTTLKGNDRVLLEAVNSLGVKGTNVKIEANTSGTIGNQIILTGPNISFRELYTGGGNIPHDRHFIFPDKENGTYTLATTEDIPLLEDAFPLGDPGQILQYDETRVIRAVTANSGHNLPLGTEPGTVAEGDHTHTYLINEITRFNIPIKEAGIYTLATIEDIQAIDSLPAGTEGQLITYDENNVPLTIDDPYKNDMTRAGVQGQYRFNFLVNNDTLIIDAQGVRNGFYNISIGSNIYSKIYIKIINIPVGAKYSLSIDGLGASQVLFTERIDSFDYGLKYMPIPSSAAHMLLEYTNTNGHSWDATWDIVNEDFGIYRYLRLTGGTLTGDLNMSNDRDIIIPGGSSIRNDTAHSNIQFLETTELQLSVGSDQSIFTVLTNGRISVSRDLRVENPDYTPSLQFQQTSDIKGVIAVGTQGGDENSIALTESRTYYMPNKTGVVALISDLITLGGEDNTIGNSDAATGTGLAFGKSGVELRVKKIAAAGGLVITDDNTNGLVTIDGTHDHNTQYLPLNHAASGVTTTKISNWDTAFGWGNHASVGYLTSFTETDPTVPSHVKAISTTKISNWDTAFGWGNHAGLYSLLGHTHAYDNYQSWNLKTNGIQRTTIGSGGILDINAGSNVTISYGAGGVVTINSSIYTHPAKTWVDKTALSGAMVISNLTVNSLGHLTDWTTRSLTAANVGALASSHAASGVTTTRISNWDTAFGWGNHDSLYLKLTGGTLTGSLTIGAYTLPTASGSSGQVLMNNGAGVVSWGTVSSGTSYTHPAKAWVDKTSLSGAVVISNLTIDSTGHPTNWTTRSLTSSDVGALASSHAASGVTTTRISNWDTAFGWGNHASVGYLTSLPAHNHDSLYLKLTGGTLTGSLTIGGYTLPTASGTNGQTLINNGAGGVSWGTIPSGKTYSNFTYTTSGLVPAPGGAGTTRFLREDGSWVTVSSGTSYTHPPKAWLDKASLTGAVVISNLTIDSTGHPTNWTTRNLTAANVGALSSSHAASSVTYSRIVDWDTAYGWGNHASVGYLTSLPAHNHDSLYLKLTGGTLTGGLTNTTAFPLSSTWSGYKSWTFHRSTNNSLYLTSSSAANNTTWDWSKQIVFGDAGDITASRYMYAVDFYLNSDIRLKTNIRELTDASLKVNQIDTFYHTWVDSDEETLGVSAQQIKEILPQVVHYDKSKDKYTVTYGKIVPLLIEAHKEHSKKIEEQDILIKNLIERMNELERRVG